MPNTDALKHILVLDEGTTSTRAVLFDAESTVVDEESHRLSINAPSAAIVEQDAAEIAARSAEVLRSVIGRATEVGRDIAAVGVTNQRTTTILWDRHSGEPVAPVISWQDTRTQHLIDSLREEWSKKFTSRTGLQFQPANVALHLAVLLQDDDLRRKAEAGDLLAGTPDTWVIWKLTGGPNGGRHVTSYSNAGSSGAFDLHADAWWGDWLGALRVPKSLLPEVLEENAHFGDTDPTLVGAALPIRADFADQQSALFGHGGFDAGAVKCTHGTGSFIDFNIGSDLVIVDSGLDTRLAWRTADEVRYMYEGSSFVTGSAIDWLVDSLRILPAADQLDATYERTPDSSGVVFVPALAGFTAPHWDQTARGVIFGLHRGVTADHLIKATVDGIASTTADLVLFMSEKSGARPEAVLADGGLSRSDALLQAQADNTGVPVVRAADTEHITARGAAWMAGIGTGVWSSAEEASAAAKPLKTFEPRLSERQFESARRTWLDTIDRVLGWSPQTD